MLQKSENSVKIYSDAFYVIIKFREDETMQNPPIEIERKYIVRKPNESEISLADGYSRSEILQIYLNSPPGVTHRIRMRKFDNGTSYTETVKRRIDRISAYEDEHEISEEEFKLLRKNKKQRTRPVNKVRHTFSYLGKTFELDVYPHWRRTCIMEVELSDRSEPVALPPFIRVIKEVTGDKCYSNASMSREFPKESDEGNA